MLYPVEVFVRSRRAVIGSISFAVLFAILSFSAFGSVIATNGSVTLTWNKCADSCVAGYNVYYGGACDTYTNEIRVGNATNVTISGLTVGATYYFAATSYTISGMESPFSSEVSCWVSTNAPVLTCSNTYTAFVCTNLFQFRTNTLRSGQVVVQSLPPICTNYVFTGFWLFAPAGTWTLQSSSNLLTWSDYVTGTNAVFIPKTNGICFFRLKSP